MQSHVFHRDSQCLKYTIDIKYQRNPKQGGNIDGNIYSLETILVQIKDHCGVGVFNDPVTLRSALKDYHTMTRDTILICAIVEEYGSSFKNIVSNPTFDSINRLSEKIASDRFITDVEIVKEKKKKKKKKTGENKIIKHSFLAIINVITMTMAILMTFRRTIWPLHLSTTILPKGMP